MVSSGEKNTKNLLVTKMMIIKLKGLIRAYVLSYDDESEWMNFLIMDDDLLKKCLDIWNKAKSNIKKELDCQPIYNKRF